jgi:hypothetical protein
METEPSLIRVRAATELRDARQAEWNEAQRQWKEAIRGAWADGLSLRAIADEAGCTHPRVYQILHERD